MHFYESTVVAIHLISGECSSNFGGGEERLFRTGSHYLKKNWVIRDGVVDEYPELSALVADNNKSRSLDHTGTIYFNQLDDLLIDITAFDW
jgi:hypothetical protein